LAQEELPELRALLITQSVSNLTYETSSILKLTKESNKKPNDIIEVPTIITLRGPNLSITVPPIVAPAKVTQDDTDPIHAVTDLFMRKLVSFTFPNLQAARSTYRG
jgi:hypothetical protein